jgi:phosphatidylethanolamine/phosphatidyl-N-methylethanolamine N-methyltransferase
MNVNSLTNPRQTGGEIAFFLRRWLADPLRVGAIMPSAPALTRRMAREVRLRDDDDVVVELGPGTGAVTRALIHAGVPEERLILVERDPKMCAFLRRRFPSAQLIQGDTGCLEEVLPARWHGRVGTVVSSLPLVSLPRKHLNLVGRKVAFAGVNLPPASVWRYRRPLGEDRARAP